jgi:D-hexose-6-phosphate mutarotase
MVLRWLPVTAQGSKYYAIPSFSGDYSVSMLTTFTNGCTDTVTRTFSYKASPAPLGVIYPNPTSGQITVEINSASAEFKLYSVTGVLLHTYTLTSSVTEIDLSGLPKAMYIYCIQAEHNRQYGKVVVSD